MGTSGGCRMKADDNGSTPWAELLEPFRALRELSIARHRPRVRIYPPVTPKRERPRCGAKCRDGHPCQAPVVWECQNNRPRNGRCRMHDGLSTGPETLEGRARTTAGYRRRLAERRAKKG